jgi:hypothetical protein
MLMICLRNLSDTVSVLLPFSVWYYQCYSELERAFSDHHQSNEVLRSHSDLAFLDA